MKNKKYFLGLLLSSLLLFSFTYVENNGNSSDEITSLIGYQFNFPCQQGNGLRADYFADTHLGRKVTSAIESKIDMNLYQRSPKPNIDGNQFSIRWSGGVYAPETGQYTFHMRVDDGARIWIGEQLVLDKWDLNEATDFEFKVNMYAGNMYALKVEYVQFMYNDAVAQLKWSTPSSSEQLIPTEYLYTCPQNGCFANPAVAAYFESLCKDPEPEMLEGRPFEASCREGNGLTAEYFSGTKLKRSVQKTIEPTINFSYYRQRPKPNMRGDEFSIRWTGGLFTPEAGKYTFYFTVDDGARVWIDDKLVIDEWDLHEATEFQVEANVSGSQMHTIRVEYVQFMYDEAIAKFEWETPSGQRSVVPMQNLYPVANVNCKDAVANETTDFSLETPKKKAKVKKGIVAVVIIAILTALQITKAKPGNY